MKVTSVSCADMVGRHVVNSHGAEFRIVSIRYELDQDKVCIWLAECDGHGRDSGTEETGVFTLKGWTLL